MIDSSVSATVIPICPELGRLCAGVEKLGDRRRTITGAMSPYDPPGAITVVAVGGDAKPGRSHSLIVPMLSLL